MNVEKVIICLLSIIVLFCFIRISHLWKQINKQNFKIKELESDIVYYESKINILNFKFKELINNQEIIEAVKYAMKKSHPDNGGNAEDFKKYRELYNRVK